MTDIISRADAIDAVLGLAQLNGRVPTDSVIFQIKALPSAELTLQTPQTYGKSINPSNAEVVEDIISRADAIKAVEQEYKIDRRYTADDYTYGFNQAIQYVSDIILQDIPSAETHEIRTETHSVCSDCISRADAIEAMCNDCGADNGDFYPNCGQKEYCAEVQALLALPSAEAEWIPREHFDVLKKNYDMLAGLLVEAKARAIGAWIPCSERLPSEDGRYLVTYPLFVLEDKWVDALWYGEPCMPNRKVKGKCWYRADNEWGDVVYDDSEILAWMPLPTPYKGGDDE